VERKGQNLQIKATTYILNERTGKKIGFNYKKTDFFQTLILIINYPNLLVTKSFANNVLSFPNLKKNKNIQTDINSLIKKSNIEKLNTRLKETINKIMSGPYSEFIALVITNTRHQYKLI
jgi:hypothetical protein